MDSEEQRIRQHLAEAERHVSQGERLVEHQRMTIEERLRDGHDIELPMQVLAQMEEALRLHIEGRDRVRQELAEVNAHGLIGDRARSSKADARARQQR